ncbi:LytR C-terminal domain-containing protein [Luteipulveratus halotolerans]|uniref:LytR C-terminal domain-containing protein n=1 Tax=Luteipulveratus halotolerans TaxID=1631356 RepID=UPI000680D90C|nr:LytR C-terminal domain-containing protein [Luteipulveratus halotolerans]
MSQTPHRRPYETGLARARRRRHRRSVAVITIVGLMVVGGFAYATAYWQQWLPGQASGTEPTCVVTTTAPPDPKTTFTLNIYNAGGEQGRANDVALGMKNRGFDVGIVGNDPYKKKLSGVGELRYGATGEAKADQLVRDLAPGITMVQDGRTDTSVDLVLGQEFPTLPQVTKAPEPESAC